MSVSHRPEEDAIDQPRSTHPGATPGLRQLRFDVDARPFLVLLELTRACDLACRHCRAEAVPARHPDELSTEEVKSMLDDLSGLGAPRPRLVFTGGDPLQRPDLDDLVRHGADGGLAVAVSPAGTPRATPGRLASLRAAGAGAVSFSIDGHTAAVHDSFRRVEGSFDWTLAGCRSARDAGLRLQINTTVTRATATELPGIARLVSSLGAVMWSVFFVVPVGRAGGTPPLTPAETEDVLHFLHDVATVVPLKTTEAPAYRRVVLEGLAGRSAWVPGPLYVDLWEELSKTWPEAAARAGGGRAPDGRRRSPLAVGDGRGVVFVSHTGDVQPSGFLPLAAGNVRQSPLSTIYANSPLLRSLRDPSRLGGRCGRCEYSATCGGSRAQAYGRSGDPLAEDGSCPYPG